MNRRRSNRRVPSTHEALSRVRLRAGRELEVLDVSDRGALVEGVTRLLPGTHAEVHVITRHGRLLVRSRVMRAYVWRLEADVVCYRAALAFETEVDTACAGYDVPAQDPTHSSIEGSHYPASSATILSSNEQTLSA